HCPGYPEASNLFENFPHWPVSFEQESNLDPEQSPNQSPTHRAPFTSHHSALTTHHSPLTTHHSALPTHHSPLAHRERRPSQQPQEDRRQFSPRISNHGHRREWIRQEFLGPRDSVQHPRAEAAPGQNQWSGS